MFRTELILILAGLIGLGACGEQANSAQQSTSQTTGSDQQSASNNFSVFQLSALPPPEIGSREGNWCHAPNGAGVVVNAEQINTNRRYFYLPDGVTILVVGPSTSAATVLLQPLANRSVEIFTGANFPECLSTPANLSPAGGAAILAYNNYKNIKFQMELQEENGQSRVTLEFPPGANYGMTVNRCPECR